VKAALLQDKLHHLARPARLQVALQVPVEAARRLELRT
jgi:hypothetical protein